MKSTTATGELADVISLPNRASKGREGGRIVPLHHDLRTALATPKVAEAWSLTILREKLIKIGAKVVSHGCYVTFQLVEVAVPRRMFAGILLLIARLRVPPAQA